VKRHSLVLALALATAVTAVGAAPARTTAAACKTSELVVWLGGTGDAAAGSRYVTLEFTNQSGHTCTLTGYPWVSALDLRGHALGSPGSRNPSTTRVVRLANGDTAGALLRIVVAANFPASTCHPRAAAAVRVFPPNQTASKIVPIPFQACSRSGPIFLSVKTVA
jgi:Protein of unknown function (DUF4232)